MQNRELSKLNHHTFQVAYLWILAGLLAFLPAQCATAQFFVTNKPKVIISIMHPAEMGNSIAGRTLAFGQIEAEPMCQNAAHSFRDRLTSHLQNHNINIMEWDRLQSILNQHQFQMSGEVDQSTAVKIGKMIGPAIMLFIDVTRCRPNQKHLTQTAQPFLGPPVQYMISEIRYHFRGAIRAVDLQTGQDLRTIPIKADVVRDNKSTQGWPEFPSRANAQDDAIKLAVASVDHAYFNWSQKVPLNFMDDKQCQMKQILGETNSGDIGTALQAAQQSVQRCAKRNNKGQQADAWYDLGVIQMLAGNYQAASSSLEKAQIIHNKPNYFSDAVNYDQMALNFAPVLARQSALMRQSALARKQSQAQRLQQQ